MAATMKDIARIAGCTRQAVSSVFNKGGTTKVSPATREHILKIARELHFVPNQNARQLKGASSNTIGIYGVPYASVLNQSLFNLLSVELERYGYNLMACYGMTEEVTEHAIRRLFAKGIDGMIITTQNNPIFQYDLPPIPYVFMPPAATDAYDISVDHSVGTKEAAEYLLRAGRKKTLFLTPMSTGIYSLPTQQKFEGIRSVMPDVIFMNIAEANGNTEVILQNIINAGVDSVFCSNDYFAGRLIQLLLGANIKVPEDIMVVGYDGLAICDLCAVPLATVIQPISAEAKAAVDLLLQRINSKDCKPEPAGISLKPYFYPSCSCGAEAKTSQLPLYNSYSSLEAIWRTLTCNNRKEIRLE